MDSQVFKFGDTEIELNMVEMQRVKERYEQLLLMEYISENWDTTYHDLEKLAAEVLDYKYNRLDDKNEGIAIHEVFKKYDIRLRY